MHDSKMMSHHDILAQVSDPEVQKKIFGSRLSTSCGYSANQRK
jgi:hypothetical protein